MKYKVTCLTPTLVGDGQKLAPIDYMVWKDHVNVLDQRRIFRLLAKGPRLEGYLTQLKKADRLDFASWGGFAQNFAGRRIPFEHTSLIPVWEKAHSENLFIPTFAISPAGPYLPATALKGALRTGSVFDRWNETTMKNVAERITGDRMPRYLASGAEDAALGGSANNRMRRVGAGDSGVIPYSDMKVYLLRVSTLVARGEGRFELGWKSTRGSVESKRIDDSTPIFAEMASPGTSFEGSWMERSPRDRARIFQAANQYAGKLIERHRDYAARTGMTQLSATMDGLAASLAEAAKSENRCLMSIGWGGGLVGKSAYLNAEDESYRAIMRQIPMYQRAIQTGMPFPKTRKVIFEKNQPASLAGWVSIEVA